MSSVGAIVIGALFVAVFGLIGAVAVRRPLLARLAMREAIRRRLQSVIVIGGLMIGSGAILGPQIWNDSVTDSLAAAAYRSWGRVDLTVTAGGSYFSPEVADRIAADPAVRKSVAGVQEGLEAVGSVVDVERDEATPNVRLIGFDAANQAPFGDYVRSDGTHTDGQDLASGDVLTSRSLADAIRARAGDHLQVMIGDHSAHLRIADVVRPDGPGAYGLRPALFIPLPTLQSLLGTDLINVVRITARGDGQAELDAARAAAPAVRTVLATDFGGPALEVREDKAMEANAYQKLNDSTRPFFIAMSLFVVAVGAALVINLALTLAEERRPRMAVLRALGVTRAGLVAVSVIEGGIYSLVAAVAGIVPAALVGWAMSAYTAAFERGAINGRDVVFEPSLRPATVATALAAGALITIAILFFASIRTSRMAIASAIRQLPEPAKPLRRSWLRLAAMVGLGLIGTLAVLAGNTPVRLVGGVALIVLASMLARDRLPDRGRATVAGLAVTGWSFGMLAIVASSIATSRDPNDTIAALATVAIGTATSVFGLSFVLAANLRLVEGLSAIPGRAAAGVRVSLRPPLAYLTRRPLQAALATSAFALVVAMQALTTGIVFTSSRADDGATPYDVVATSSGKPDLSSVRSMVDRQVAIPTRVYIGPARSRTSRYEATIADWRQLSIPLYSLSDEMLRNPFARLYNGPAVASNQQELWTRLRQDPTAVVASLGTPGDTVTLKSPGGGEVKLTVVANFPLGFMSGVAGSARALAPFADLPVGTTLLIRVAPGSDPVKVARAIRRAFVGQGVDATTTRELLDQGASQSFASNTLVRFLMGMGMAVAVFSLGILALRAVVERRRAIGVLRALGYQPRQVLAGMLGEGSLSATLGVAIGLAVGVVAFELIRNAVHLPPPPLADEAAQLLLIYIGVLALTLAVTAGPSLRASRLTPVEALRVVD